MRWSLCCVLFSFLLIHYFLFPITSVISLPSLIQKVHLKCIYFCILKLNSKLTFVIRLLFVSHVIPVETCCWNLNDRLIKLHFSVFNVGGLNICTSWPCYSFTDFFFPTFLCVFSFSFLCFHFLCYFFYICWKGVDGGGSMRRCAENYGLVRHRINIFLFDVNNFLNIIPKIQVWKKNVGNSFKKLHKSRK